MPIINQPPLSLSGVQFLGYHILYDEKIGIPGNHLRWNFNAEIGFPPGGFTLTRAVWNPQFFSGDNNNLTHGFGSIAPVYDWSIHLNLPLTQIEAIERIHIGFTNSELSTKFANSADELVKVAQQLTDPGDPNPMFLRYFEPTEETGLKTKLRKLDTVLIAALDPYLARMTGLYYIDDTGISSETYLYRITGHWGDQTYPLIPVNFGNQYIRPKNQSLQFGAVKVVSSGRTVGVRTPESYDLIEHPQLTVYGTVPQSIKLYFDFPVEEVIIDYDAVSSTRTTRRTLNMRGNGAPFRARLEETQIFISRPGNAFERLEFVDLPAGNWFFFRINYRKKIGPIEDVSGLFVLDPTASQPVKTPEITKLIPEPMPALLNELGEINNEASQVAISAGLIKPNISEIDVPESIDFNRILHLFEKPIYPVRLLFGASSPRATALPQRILNLREGIYSPALFRENTRAMTLPNLLGYWPLNGQYTNAKGRISPTVLGSPRFVKEHAFKPSAFSVKFHGNGALSLEAQDHLKALGAQFTLEVTLKIDPATVTGAMLIGNNPRRGFRLGLIRSSDGNYKLRLNINNRRFDATSPLLPNYWVRVSAVYSGSQVWFHYSDPAFAVPEDPIAAELGSVTIPIEPIVIGAEVSSVDSSLTKPFIGTLADICIWQKVIHPSESTALLTKWGPFLNQQHTVADMIYNDQKTYVCSTGRDPIYIDQTGPLLALGNTFSIFLFVNPHNTNIQYPTVVGNKYFERLWIGLNKTGSSFKVRVYVNGRRFDSTSIIPAQQWSHIGLRYDGRNLTIYINGTQDSNFSATLGILTKNTLPLGIGSDTGTTVVSQQYRFNGFIQGIQFWRKAITVEEWLSNISTVQHIDKYLANGRYFYAVKGIDLFGRTSTWSRTKDVRTLAEPIYQPPVNVHAEFLPLIGIVEGVMETDDAAGKYYELITTLEFNADIASKIMGYDATISRMVELPNQLTGVSEMTKVDQLLEIDTYENRSGNAFIRVKKVPFIQLFPANGDMISINLDYNFRLKWAWTGTQQLYFPEVNAFKLFELKGTLNEITGRIASVTSVDDFHHTIIMQGTLNVRSNELNGEKCLIGPHMFTIESHTAGSSPRFTVVYSGRPAIIPKKNDLLRITLKEEHSTYIPYSEPEEKRRWTDRRVEIPTEGPNLHSTNTPQRPSVLDLATVTFAELKTDPPSNDSVRQRQELLLAGVDWLPMSRVYKITFNRFPRPDGYTHPIVKNYIPGALVFFDNHTERNRWRSFYVLWHKWETAQQLTVFVTAGEKDEDLPSLQIDAAHAIRLYIGTQYQYEESLSSVPTFENGTATIQYHLSLTAKDNRNRESMLSRNATFVAVNRKRPPKGPQPDANIKKKADYYDQCQVEVSWDDLNSPIDKFIKYKLYRANDSAIYTRDLELRRTRQAFYRGLSLAEVFADDPDFGEWFNTLNPRVTMAALFPEKDTSAWQEITVVWRRWADRFYPALNNEELNVIGMRAGNEKAFVLITAKPIAQPKYLDSVNGIVRNRYYYRLRLINDSLSESSIWGPLSDPIVTPAVMPPRQPVFTKVEAGDRQITLHWALNQEPDLKEYLLYRAETKEELEDLRWWSREADPRIVTTIPDPRIKTLTRAVSLPGELPIGADGILGVYMLDEFDREADAPNRQTHALNYWNPTPANADELASVFTISPDGVVDHAVTNLRRVANGKSVAVVYRDTSGEVQVVTQLHEQIPYVDEGLEGLKDYYYRLVAVNDNNNKSTASKVQRIRTLELTNYSAPSIVLVHRQRSTDHDEIRLAVEVMQPGVELLLQYRAPEQQFWRTLIAWTPTYGSHIFDDTADINESKIYRAIVRGKSLRTSFPSMELLSIPNSLILDDLIS